MTEGPREANGDLGAGRVYFRRALWIHAGCAAATMADSEIMDGVPSSMASIFLMSSSFRPC